MVGNIVADAGAVAVLASVITVVHDSVLCTLIPIIICEIIRAATVSILLLNCLGCWAAPLREGASVIAPV